MKAYGLIGWLGLAGAVVPAGAEVENWPRFRGSGGLGVAPGQSVPVELNEENRAWAVRLPGAGSSSPVVWGEHLFVTAQDGETEEVALICLDTRKGEVRWTRTVKTGRYHTHKMNNAAAGAPCAAEGVVAFSWYDAAREMAMLTAYDHDGECLWDYEIGPFQGQHGVTLQPAVHQGRILLAHLHQGGGCVVAVEAKSGKVAWKTDYPEASPKTTYITPLVRERLAAEGPRQEVVVASTSVGVRGLDFETGKELWALPDEFPERCIVSPVDILAGSGLKDSLVTVGCKNGVFFAVRPPDVKGGSPEVAWRLEKHTPYVPTPVSDGRTLYVLSDGGMLQAVDPRSGVVRWSEKLPGNFYASPLLIGGRLYCLSREGEMYVAEVGDAFRLLATSELEPGEEVTWTDATPAVAHNSLYVRLGARLDCYRQGN